MPLPDDRPIPAMESVLSSVIHFDSFTGATSNLLARHPSQPDPNWARKAARHLLGRHRKLHLLLSGRPAMGDKQSLVGNRQRWGELAAQIRRAMGWEAVGLDRGDGQVRIPDGRVLFCNGLGRGVAPRIQRVLNRSTTTTTTSDPQVTPFPPRRYNSHPRSCGVPGVRRERFSLLPRLASHGARDKSRRAGAPVCVDRQTACRIGI